MKTIIGVRFRKSTKTYYFDPENHEIHKGDHVIVETVRGVEYGLVVLPPTHLPDEKVPRPLKTIIRPATEADDATNKNNELEEQEAFTVCQEKIREHGLDMKLIDSEYTFDRNKLLFYFTADGRIDFRELVKDLASVFRTRIELRQIGVRDEARLLGGIGICGRTLCCHAFLEDFSPVSIKMAKEQNLPLNPSKISGICGRLMCCLKNEQEAYEYLNSTMPHVGAHVTTFNGYQGYVQSVSVLKQKVKVLIIKDNDEKELREYKVNELRFDNRRRQAGASVNQTLPDEEVDENTLKELEQLEKKDREDAAEETEQNGKTGKYRQGRRRGGRNNRDREHYRDSGDYRRERRGHGDNSSDFNENYRGRKNHGDNFSKNPKNREENGAGQDRWEHRRDSRKGRRNHGNHYADSHQPSEEFSEGSGSGRTENKNPKARYRNTHKSNRGRGRR